MPYTVNRTNSSAEPGQYTVADSVINTETDLSFIGKGYAGYGESIAENFLHLLENFSNTSAPSKPISGQLWWDSTNSRLKVYNNTAFVPAGSNASYQAGEPSSMVAGDLWINSTSNQLYFYTGSANVLVGPSTSSGNTNGFTYHTILDSADANQNVTKWFNDGNLIAMISEDEFTPKTAISGFATIKKGITLTSAIADTKFQGTSTDSDALGGVAAANYFRSNENDTTSGTIGIINDSGMTLGADNDLSLTVDSGGVVFSNVVTNTDIDIKVTDAGTLTNMIHIDGADAMVGIKNTSPTTALDVTGTVTATAFAGPLTGAVTGNVTGDLTGNVTGNVTGSAGSITAVDADTTTVSNLEVDNLKAATLVTEAEGISSNDNDTTLPTSAAVKDYVDAANVLGDLSVIGSTITAPSNADLTLQQGGTGNVIIGALRLNGTTISSDDSSAIKINETLHVTTLKSDDSSQVTVDDGLTVSGAVVMMASLPTSDPSNAGQLWNDSGDLKVSAG